jgi:hypothetical protein
MLIIAATPYNIVLVEGLNSKTQNPRLTDGTTMASGSELLSSTRTAMIGTDVKPSVGNFSPICIEFFIEIIEVLDPFNPITGKATGGLVFKSSSISANLSQIPPAV